MITQVVTKEMVCAASVLIRIAHTDDASLARALGKAETRLFDLAWTVDCGILQIASHSHSTDTRCTDGETCTCETTRGVCWHRASWWLLSTIAAAGINPVAPLPLPAAALDENIDDYPGDFLDSLPDDDYPDLKQGWDEYGDRLPLAPAPFRLQPAQTYEPVSGSDFERAQRLVDELAA